MNTYTLTSTVTAKTPALAHKRFKRLSFILQILYEHFGSEMLEEDVPLYIARDFVTEKDGVINWDPEDGFARLTLTYDKEHTPNPSGCTSTPDKIPYDKHFAQNSLAYGIQNGMEYRVEYCIFWQKAMQWYYICEEINNEDRGFDIRSDSELLTARQLLILYQWILKLTDQTWHWNSDIRMWQKEGHAASRMSIIDAQQMVSDHENAVGPPPF